MNIYLVRHTKVNVSKAVCYGQTDVELAPGFEKVADTISKKLPFDRSKYKVFSSPLSRCLSLAGKISDCVILKDDLMELNFGSWEMKHWDDIPREQIERWNDNLSTFIPPDGESFTSLEKRVINLFNNLLEDDYDKVIVSHAGPIRTIIANILEMPIKNIFRIKLNYGGVVKLKIDKEIKTVEFL